jgi:two-component system sensor histidine kinase PilS (NtrC family)
VIKAGVPAPISDPPGVVEARSMTAPLAGASLYRKLVALTGIRILVGTALLGATAWLSFSSGEEFIRAAQGLLYGIIAASYFGSLLSIYFLRSGRFLTQIAYGQIAGDIAAATGLVYLTGGAESIFTILYPLAIVNGAIGLSRRGANLAALISSASFLFLAVGGERGFLRQPGYLEHSAISTPRLALTLAANLSAFLFTAALAGYLADALVGARRQLQRAETELTALSALHESITRSISSGILTIDGAQRITFVNPAAEEISGRKLRDVRGKMVTEIFPDFAQALVRGLHGRGETVVAHADGTQRVVGFSLSPLVDAGTPSLPGFVTVFQDLTGLRRMEEAVRRSDRLAAVGQLAAGLAHEIRNPLASMSGSIELLAGAPNLDDKDRRLMQIVLRESERLEVLVRDFLSFARPEKTELVELHLSPLVREVLELFNPAAVSANLRLVHELDEHVSVRGDPGQLRQVLWNLLRNAVDAAPSGEVRVQVGLVPGFAREVQLAVHDTGSGISADDRAHIFEPFFTTKPQGSGLGLATVHRIIEAHQGRIELDSEPARGTTFTIFLPSAA